MRGENREAGVTPARARRGNRGAATHARPRGHWPSGLGRRVVKRRSGSPKTGLAPAATLTADAADRFAQIKIDGVLESSLSIVVTYDPGRGSPAVLGRHAIADAGLYSVCLAIQNLWLAATAEELGVGWVSFYREPYLQELLGIPAGIRPVGWLCLGPVTHLEQVPDLERHGWRQRRPVATAIHTDRWGVPPR